MRLKAYFPQSDETLERQLSGVSSPDFMAAMRAQSGHLRSEKVVPPLPHVGHFRSNPHAGLELHRLTGTSAMYFAMKCLEQAVVLASKSILRLAFAGGGIT